MALNQSSTMKIDTYTKLVLSVIAVSLAMIALKDVPVVSTAQAASDEAVLKVQLVGIKAEHGLGWMNLPVTIIENLDKKP